jgi:hypothetical protein
MNAVNWIKRRVSLSSSPTIQQSALPEIQHSPNNTVTSNEQKTATPTNDNSSRLSSNSHTHMSQHNPAPMMLQHDIIDPSSPLSILAATSKLTTFPYGELQALNARMNMEASKLNGLSVNGVNGINMLNRSNSAMSGDEEENSMVAVKPLLKQTRLSKERVNPPLAMRPLLPSALPGPIPSTQYTTLDPPRSSTSNIFQPHTRPVKQRNVTTSAIPRNRAVPVPHKRSVSLSSTQNTRSSKRIKTSHPSPPPSIATPLSPSTPPPKPVRPPRPTAKSKSHVPPPENKKRVLPVRQGQVDILDGEISLLSTPQRLDSTSLPPRSLI